MPTPDANDLATEKMRDLFTRYSEELQRAVAAKLVKPRTAIPADELVDKLVSTLLNPPVMDRRLSELPDSARKALAVIGLSRRTTWTVGSLVLTLAALGHAEGMTPITTLLDHGLACPVLPPGDSELSQWETALGGEANIVEARIVVHPQVAARGRNEDLGLPTVFGEPVAAATPQTADGLDWPLRLCVVRQQIEESLVRLTQANTLFKRDHGRLQTDAVLAASVAEQLRPVPDAGVLALFWAQACGLLEKQNGELRAAPFPESWGVTLAPTLVDLWAGLTAVDPWDPLKGYAPSESGQYPTATAGLLAALLLAKLPANQWADAQPIADWLWANHPSWQGVLPKEEGKSRGRGWVEAYVLGVLQPLRVVEAIQHDGVWKERLADFGRWLLVGGDEPTSPPPVPQCLLIQPNAEILAYRHGLTPQLVAKLSRFAQWKTLGPACTLELTATRTYHGLESGVTLSGIQQALNQHGMKPVPPPVTDLLRRWADKRDRLTLFTSATLVEFQTPADLDAAVARGIVSVRVTDRIALSDDGRDPDFKFLRLVGNRDYEAKPQQCLAVAPDGVTLLLDPTNSDLLLEAEIVRIAEALPGDVPSVRRFLLTPASLKVALDAGYTLDTLDDWFHLRAGQRLPPAARLFTLGTSLGTTETLRIVSVATAEIADGLVQWPATAELIADRLGPETLHVTDENLAKFREVVSAIGITIEDG
jgi:hypothetical protein